MDGKFFQEIFQNGAKMKGFGRLGDVLGGSWSVLGLLGVSWGRLEASCERPGGVLGRLGSVLARKRWPTWFQLGPQNGARIEKKSKQKSIKILMALGIDFGEGFEGSGVQKWSHVGTQMEPKMDLMLRTPKIKKTLKNQWNFNDF